MATALLKLFCGRVPIRTPRLLWVPAFLLLCGCFSLSLYLAFLLVFLFSFFLHCCISSANCSGSGDYGEFFGVCLSKLVGARDCSKNFRAVATLPHAVRFYCCLIRFCLSFFFPSFLLIVRIACPLIQCLSSAALMVVFFWASEWYYTSYYCVGKRRRQGCFASAGGWSDCWQRKRRELARREGHTHTHRERESTSISFLPEV